MKYNRIVEKHPSSPQISTTGNAIRLWCLLIAFLMHTGGSAAQPIGQAYQNEALSDATPFISASSPENRVEDKTPLITENETNVTASENNTIYFPLGTTAVDDTDKEKLRQHSEYLKQNPKKFVTLVGYADDQGSRNYNLAITEERLTEVSNLLRANGVPSRQIRRNRIGSVKKNLACRSTDCRQKMRRVELLFSP